MGDLMKKFYNIVTHAGLDAITQAVVSGDKVLITHMAAGDGGGAMPTPSPEQTSLVSEKYRAPLNSLRIFEDAGNMLVAEMVIPSRVGGFWVRELGLYTDNGVLIAVGNLPESYKPQVSEGSAREQCLRMVIAVNSVADIDITLNPAIVTATVQYVDEAVETAVEKAEEALETAKEKATFDGIYPPGICIFFAANINPNEQWPGTRWHYTGENKTIRIGKADGTDVGGEGGSDTVTITRANLPQSVLNVSGSTSEQGAQTLQTTPAGRHRHQGGMSAPGEAWDGDYIVGSDNDSHRTRNYTSEAEDHVHDATVPPHAHTVWAQTEALGQGQAISIVEKHIKLMCWYRAA